MSHTMGLAAPGHVEHRLSTHLLSSGSMPGRPHSLTSVFTHSDYVFQGLPFFLVPEIWKFVIDFIMDVAYCPWPYNLSRWQQRTSVMSLMSCFCSSEAEGVSSVFDATNPMDYDTVIVAQPPQLGFLWSPRFATMEHSRANAGLVHHGQARVSWTFLRPHNMAAMAP